MLAHGLPVIGDDLSFLGREGMAAGEDVRNFYDFGGAFDGFGPKIV